MRIHVLIVNYRTAGLVVDCLGTLHEELGRCADETVRVTVVDNASGDDSVALIGQAIHERRYGDWCQLVAAARNGGFAYGNNVVLRELLAQPHEAEDLVWLLNPDTLVHAGALAELIAFMRAHPDVGIAGGRAENLDGSVRCSAFRFHSALGEFEQALQFGPVSRMLSAYRVALEISDTPVRVDWVSGASMMVRMSVLQSVGLLDEDYFMYYEETDFCLRAARAGFPCWYVPGSRIVHLVGQSSGVTGTQKARKRRPRYWFASRALYFRKNHGRRAWHLANLCWLLAYPLGGLWLAVRGRHRDDPPQLWRDFIRHNYLEPV